MVRGCVRKGEVMRVRESKFELLRIVCMLFVVTEHLVPHITDMQNIYRGVLHGQYYKEFLCYSG